jgi:hypothetical protein
MKKPSGASGGNEAELRGEQWLSQQSWRSPICSGLLVKTMTPPGETGKGETDTEASRTGKTGVSRPLRQSI